MLKEITPSYHYQHRHQHLEYIHITFVYISLIPTNIYLYLYMHYTYIYISYVYFKLYAYSIFITPLSLPLLFAKPSIDFFFFFLQDFPFVLSRLFIQRLKHTHTPSKEKKKRIGSSTVHSFPFVTLSDVFILFLLQIK
jgi:hypothetical protein